MHRRSIRPALVATIALPLWLLGCSGSNGGVSKTPDGGPAPTADGSATADATADGTSGPIGDSGPTPGDASTHPSDASQPPADGATPPTDGAVLPVTDATPDGASPATDGNPPPPPPSDAQVPPPPPPPPPDDAVGPPPPPADAAVPPPPPPDAAPPPQVPDTLDCAALCDTFQTECPSTFALRATCPVICQTIVDGIVGPAHPETYTRADLLCRLGLFHTDCDQIYGCLMDSNDGISAYGDRATIRYNGLVGGAPVDLRSNAAFMAVGTKADGSPGDFDTAFEVGGVTYVMSLNNFAPDWLADPATVINNRATLKTTAPLGYVRLRVTDIRTNDFSLNGRVDLDLMLSDPADATIGQIELTISGALRQ